MMNLLTDPVFRALTPAGPIRFSLPELLSSLGKDDIESLTGLQRHQEEVFHIFLCYLAGAVLAKSGETEPSQTAAFWRTSLRRLAGRNDDSGFTLLVEDPGVPAVMQPPASKRRVLHQDYRLKATASDTLDVLQTAKNHDVKTARASYTDSESWCYALINLQTSSGFLGHGNYGIARMNGGFGSRVCVGWQSEFRLGARFIRDTRRLLEQRKSLLRPPYPYQNDGQVLLWLTPWDGLDSLPLSQLDPFFIETARRVRLIGDGRNIKVFGAPSTCPRVAAKEQQGCLGDPWIPINEKKNCALSPSELGFKPELLRTLLLGDGYYPAAMQEPSAQDGSGWFCASVLIRGQGTTGGFHEAAIRIPEQVRPILFGQGASHDRLARISRMGIEIAGDILRKILRPALFALLQGGPNSLNMDKREVSAWVESAAAPFLNSWRLRYFDWLWTIPDEPDDNAALRPWVLILRDLAQQTLNRAMLRAPTRGGRSYRAKTHATGRLSMGLRKHFSGFLEEIHDRN
ncbi:MAG: type I-E CRISPR-associated protein Cse1/CasA [Deltaproteobacteria bacterium]|nr:type I-E CRISPR-associated protein Cse1/CasA [Deltaproteobacteria bacterium]